MDIGLPGFVATLVAIGVAIGLALAAVVHVVLGKRMSRDQSAAERWLNQDQTPAGQEDGRRA